MQDTVSHWQFVESKAAEMGVDAEARRKWRERGRVPHKYRLPLLHAAAEAKIELPEEFFDNVPLKPPSGA